MYLAAQTQVGSAFIFVFAVPVGVQHGWTELLHLFIHSNLSTSSFSLLLPRPLTQASPWFSVSASHATFGLCPQGMDGFPGMIAALGNSGYHGPMSPRGSASAGFHVYQLFLSI